MKYIELVEKTGKTGLIRPRDIPFFGNPSTIRPQLSKWKKQGKLIELRKGFYILPPKIRPVPPLFYLANALLFPSYVSLQSALSYYGFIPEAVFAITSVSTRRTRKFSTPLGTFIYRKIKQELFWGYSKVNFGEFYALVAVPEKALLDTVYITHEKPDSLRLQNLEDLNKEKLEKMLEKFPLWVRSKVEDIL